MVMLHQEAPILQTDAVKVYVPCKPTRPWGYRVNKLNSHDLESFLEMTKTSMISPLSLYWIKLQVSLLMTLRK